MTSLSSIICRRKVAAAVAGPCILLMGCADVSSDRDVTSGSVGAAASMPSYASVEDLLADSDAVVLVRIEPGKSAEVFRGIEKRPDDGSPDPQIPFTVQSAKIESLYFQADKLSLAVGDGINIVMPDVDKLGLAADEGISDLEAGSRLIVFLRYFASTGLSVSSSGFAPLGYDNATFDVAPDSSFVVPRSLEIRGVSRNQAAASKGPLLKIKIEEIETLLK